MGRSVKTQILNELEGRSAFINGYGNPGSPMVFCPTNCTSNENYGVHTPQAAYPKFWDQIPGYWTEPKYSSDSQQEVNAGLTQGAPVVLEDGLPVFCKKPYAVCDYPDGDLFARASIQRLLVKTTSPTCHMSMKIFLCTLYRRRCQDSTDENPDSSTYMRRGVWPVCFEQVSASLPVRPCIIAVDTSSMSNSQRQRDGN